MLAWFVLDFSESTIFLSIEFFILLLFKSFRWFASLVQFFDSILKGYEKMFSVHYIIYECSFSWNYKSFVVFFGCENYSLIYVVFRQHLLSTKHFFLTTVTNFLFLSHFIISFLLCEIKAITIGVQQYDTFKEFILIDLCHC